MFSDIDSDEETPVVYTAIASAAAAAAIKVTGILKGQMMDVSSDEYFTEEDASSQSSDDAQEEDSDTKYDKDGNRRVPLLSDWPALPSPAASRRMTVEQGVQRFHQSQAELQKSIAGVKRTQAMTAASAAANGEHATKRAKTIASMGPALDAVAIHPVRLTPPRTKSKQRRKLMEETFDRVTRILDQCTGIMKSIEKEMRDPIQLAMTDVRDNFGPELVPFGLKTIAMEFRETRMEKVYMEFSLPKKRACLKSQGLLIPPREFIMKKAVADVWFNFEDRLVPDGLEIACRRLMKPGMAEMYLVYPLAAKRAYLEREGVLRGPRTVQKPLDQLVMPSGGEEKGRVREWLASMDDTSQSAKRQRTV